MEPSPEALIEAFIESPQRGEWLCFYTPEACLRCYMRKANHICGWTVHRTLDIANVNAYPQGTGAFTLLLKAVERIAAERRYTVFVETILEERLIGFLHRRGYAWQDTPGLGFSMYKPA